MEKKLSTLLADLSSKTKHLEDSYATAKDKSFQQIEEWQNEIKYNIEWDKAAMDSIAYGWSTELKNNWEKLKSNWGEEMSKINAQAQSITADASSQIASTKADLMEKYASMNIVFALKVLENTAESVAEAIKARKKALDSNS